MGQIKVKRSYIDDESIDDLQKAGYKVSFPKGNGPKAYAIVSSDEDSADEIVDALMQNGWSKIQSNLIEGRNEDFDKVKSESALSRALAVLTEEKQVHIYNDRDTALAAFNKFKPGHTMLVRKDGKKTQYGITYGGKVKGWEYFK